MSLRVAINGFGRIGRNILRAVYENGYRKNIQIIAINDIGKSNINAHLLQFDTTHGTFKFKVYFNNKSILINKDNIAIFSERNPEKLPWKDLNIDLVMECTGIFTKRIDAAKHIKGGAKRVLISSPSFDSDATVVFGVNDEKLTDKHHIVSNASCTTNCLAPIAMVLNNTIGIETGIMTTIHSYTNDQNLCDVYHNDPYRARSASQSMIPTKTGAASAVGLVLPELKGRLDGLAIRVPTLNVSILDLCFNATRETNKEEIHAIIDDAANNSKILDTNYLPLVSIDFNHNTNSAIFDKNHTRVLGKLIKILAWYDNEWGFSNRMCDTAIAMQNHIN
ncbi:Glyceraldehyde-3-phosphate dehydrogenase [Candidatus Johnevansia muelleri]|uniref:Glyceraldehyde-3-phosphate dehydrogenase n=1 Tax=Candidatus Johnevansia muelleri TaxID=1495769 RepID=A0A078KI26_9GAMM|nr:Glyceraldehyde-3-phosphate dehydrogenase [Candidatus Evansia muelleri]